jgi:hypothetical protein
MSSTRACRSCQTLSRGWWYRDAKCARASSVTSIASYLAGAAHLRAPACRRSHGDDTATTTQLPPARVKLTSHRPRRLHRSYHLVRTVALYPFDQSHQLSFPCDCASHLWQPLPGLPTHLSSPELYSTPRLFVSEQPLLLRDALSRCGASIYTVVHHLAAPSPSKSWLSSHAVHAASGPSLCRLHTLSPPNQRHPIS